MTKQIELLQKLAEASAERAAVHARGEALQEEIDRLLARVAEAEREVKALWKREQAASSIIDVLTGTLEMLAGKD